MQPPPEYRDGMLLFISECWTSDLDDADELEFCEAMQVKDMYLLMRILLVTEVKNIISTISYANQSALDVARSGWDGLFQLSGKAN